ncbi:CBO0543 family protein [Neobacillus drentensis]|uniref:CBO0543 family protein n=1 Tax=Neobacillus drentensis TaxID=220684 RepID=UPI002FFFA78A
MNFERWMLLGFLVLSITAIFKLVPKEKARDACVLFLFLQMISWPAGLFVVEMGWIEYPTQLLSISNQYNRTSFAFEFCIFPIVAVFFSLYYPKKAKFKGAIIYYLAFTGFFTFCEVILEKYTTLVEYHGWKWYWTLSSVIVSLFLNHKYYLWFKKRLVKVEG